MLAQSFRGRPSLAAWSSDFARFWALSRAGHFPRSSRRPVEEFRLNIFGRSSTADSACLRIEFLHLAVAGNTYFWFLGALLQFVIVFYGRDILHLDEGTAAIFRPRLPLASALGAWPQDFFRPARSNMA